MMKTTRSFLLTGAIALTAMALNTACIERDINPVNTPSWDAAKISGDVVGMWYGESRSDATVKAHGGKYLLDISKFVTTGVVIASLFKDMDDGSSIYIVGTVVAVSTLIVGLVLTNKKRKKEE